MGRLVTSLEEVDERGPAMGAKVDGIGHQSPQIAGRNRDLGDSPLSTMQPRQLSPPARRPKDVGPQNPAELALDDQ